MYRFLTYKVIGTTICTFNNTIVTSHLTSFHEVYIQVDTNKMDNKILSNENKEGKKSWNEIEFHSHFQMGTFGDI